MTEQTVPESAVAKVFERNEFYRDNYRRVLLLFILSIAINAILAATAFYILTHPPAPRYFATSINGRITPLVELNKANQSEASVLQWVNEAAIASYTYNFVDYRSQLQAASLFFTTNGWRNFLNSLQASRTLDAVRARKLVVSAVATQPPVVLNQGVIGGRYAWRVRMSLVSTFQNSASFTQQRYTITMLIVRVSTLNNPRGIGIEQFVVQQANETPGQPL